MRTVRTKQKPFPPFPHSSATKSSDSLYQIRHSFPFPSAILNLAILSFFLFAGAGSFSDRRRLPEFRSFHQNPGVPKSLFFLCAQAAAFPLPDSGGLCFFAFQQPSYLYKLEPCRFCCEFPQNHSDFFVRLLGKESTSCDLIEKNSRLCYNF